MLCVVKHAISCVVLRFNNHKRAIIKCGKRQRAMSDQKVHWQFNDLDVRVIDVTGVNKPNDNGNVFG